MLSTTASTQVPARLPEKPRTVGQKAIALVKKGVDAIDRGTSPRELTHGNFEEPSVPFGILSGAADGFMLLGPVGALQGATAATASIVLQKFTRSRLAGALAATAASTGISAAALAIAGAPVALPALVAGAAVFGVYEAIRTDQEARRRDAAGGMTMFPMLLPGASKMAAAVGAGIGQSVDSKIGKIALGAVTSAALAAGITLLGPAHAVAVPVIAIAALAGGIGPSIGPRIIQALRNMSAGIGSAVNKLTEKLHLTTPEKPLNERMRNMFGAVPVTLLRTMLQSDGDIVKAAVGGAIKSVQLAYVMWAARGKMHPEVKPDPAASAPAAPPKVNNSSTDGPHQTS